MTFLELSISSSEVAAATAAVALLLFVSEDDMVLDCSLSQFSWKKENCGFREELVVVYE
jgi:hypothetical protein